MEPANLLKRYRKIINPPYQTKDLPVVIGTLLILIALPLTVVATLSVREPTSKAAGTATLSLSPSTQSVNQGSNFTVQIRENSGTEPINAVQANLSYDTAKLTFVSIDNIDDGISSFDLEFEKVGGGGSIKIARASTTPKTGVQVVAVVTFTAKISPGLTNVSFTTGSMVVRSTDHTDILGGTTGGTYTIIDPPPTVNITSPAAGSVIKGAVAVSAGASDDVGVTKVQFFDGTTQIGADDTTAPYSVSWNTVGVSNGSHNLTAKAYDGGGNVTTSPAISVTVDNQAPTTNITAPAAGSYLRGTMTVSANATDTHSSVSKVQFFVDGATQIGSDDTTAPYSVSWNTTTFSNGSHSLTAKATDTAGNVGTSAAVSVTVDNQVPTVPSGLSVVLGASDRINLSWTASTDNIGVIGYNIYRGSTKINSSPVTSTSYSDTGLATGYYCYYVKALDAAGNESGASNTDCKSIGKVGDLNGDNKVDILDASILASAWGTNDPLADLNHDTIVNIADASILSSHWGE